MPDHALKGLTKETHRTVPAQQTLARVEPLLEQMGITRVANVTGLDRIGIPVVMVTRPNSRSVAVSQGKGLSLDAAKASGVMEAIEAWHGERIGLPLRFACHADLARDCTVADISRLPKVKDSRFTNTLKTLWIEGLDLVGGEAKWLPYEMVHTDYTHPSAPGHGCFACSTNGLASGNHVLEATCHAICEVIERDATSVWHHLPAAGKGRTRINPDTVDEPACTRAMQQLMAAGIEFAVWETTTNVAVASFRCIIAEGKDRSGHIGIGDGCHVDRGIALLRALTEAVQTRMTYISGARDDILPEEFSDEAINQKCATARQLFAGGPPVRAFSTCPHFQSDRFEDDRDWLLERLQAVGCDEVISVDLTRQDMDIPVVRIVIPGLEAPHDDDTYLPGPRATEPERVIL